MVQQSFLYIFVIKTNKWIVVEKKRGEIQIHLSKIINCQPNGQSMQSTVLYYLEIFAEENVFLYECFNLKSDIYFD